MKRFEWCVAALAGVAAAVGIACASNVGVDCETGPGCVEVAADKVPTCEFQTPNDGAELSSSTVNVSVDVTNFVLEPKGSCGGKTGCGHLHYEVEECNATAETDAMRGKLDASACGHGAKVLNVVLHDDNCAVYVHNGTPIADTVTVNISASAASNHGGSGGGGDDCDCDSDSDSDKNSDKDSDSDCDSH